MARKRKSDSLLDYRVEAIGSLVCLIRKDWFGPGFLLAWSVCVIPFLAFGCFVTVRAPWAELVKAGKWPELVGISMFAIGPMFLGFFGLAALSVAGMSRIRIDLAARRTEIWYFGLLKRVIPDVPSEVVIGGISGSVWATFVYSGRRSEINLFTTPKGYFNNAKHGTDCAVKETEQLRELLQIGLRIKE